MARLKSDATVKGDIVLEVNGIRPEGHEIHRVKLPVLETGAVHLGNGGGVKFWGRVVFAILRGRETNGSADEVKAFLLFGSQFAASLIGLAIGNSPFIHRPDSSAHFCMVFYLVVMIHFASFVVG